MFANSSRRVVKTSSTGSKMAEEKFNQASVARQAGKACLMATVAEANLAETIEAAGRNGSDRK